MNFIRDLVFYLIDNGKKGVSWYEDGLTLYRWEIKNEDYFLSLMMTVYSEDNYDFSLFLNNKDGKLLNSIDINKYGVVR